MKKEKKKEEREGAPPTRTLLPASGLGDFSFVLIRSLNMHVSVLKKELTAGVPQRHVGSPLHAVKRVVVSVRFAAHCICRLLEYIHI